MNAAELARRLLIYTDNRTLSEANSAGTEYLIGAVDAINAGAQELYSLAPDFLSVRPYGLAVTAPASITIDALSAGSAATGSITGFANWMLGCTVRIGGEPENRLLSYSGGAGVLANQITTSTGTQSATVFCDCLTLPTEIYTVLPVVTLSDSRVLTPARGVHGLEWTVDRWEDFGLSNVSLSRRNAGPPRTYFITANSLSVSGTAPALQMLLSPMPDATDLVTFRARVKPVSISVSDLDAANNGASATKEIPLPAGWDEMFLLPFALQRFTASPFFNNNGIKEELARQFTTARESLWKMHPQRGRTVRFTPSY